MPIFALYNFDDLNATALDSALGNGAQNGIYLNGAAAAGGQAVLDGVNDIVKIYTDPTFQMDRGTLDLTFTLSDQPLTGTQTVLSRDSVGPTDGGYHVDILADGSVVISHETPTGTETFGTAPGFAAPGDTIDLSYSWDQGGTGGQLVINNTTDGTSFNEPVPNTLTMDMGGINQPWIVGAGQANSDPAMLNNINQFFQGSVEMFQLSDTVDNLDGTPDANPDTAVTDEDQPVTIPVLANDTDPNGQPLTVTTATAPNGTVTVNPDGTVTYVPNPNFNGSDTITYTVTDPDGNTDSSTVTVTVNPINDAPVANDDASVTDFNTPVTFAVMGNDTDVDGDVLTISGTPTSADGTVTVNPNGTLTFTPNPGFTGAATVSYSVTDPSGLTDSATWTITVADAGRDGIVRGTDGAEVIDASYVDPFDADRVDANDALLPGEVGNDDIIEAGAGNDTVFAGNGNDDVRAGTGDDSVNGNDGDDSVTGGAGNDAIYGDAGNDTLDGGADNDVIVGGAGNDSVLGGAGNDNLQGNTGDDTIDGGTGNDTVLGGDGNDVITTGGAGSPDRTYPGLYTADTNPNDDRDSVVAGSGDDVISTGDDADTIIGGIGNDLINAGVDDDLVQGGSENDTIIAGEGNDTVGGDFGNDLIYGGLAASDADPINLTDDVDLDANNNRDSLTGGAGNDTIYGLDDDDTIEGNDGNDLIDGGFDDDLISGGGENDTVLGGQGNDTLRGDFGNDSLVGGTGDDSLAGGANEDTLSGDEGNDTLVGDDGNDSLSGGLGNDSLVGGDNADTLSGGTGDDTLIGDMGNDSLLGDAGNDSVLGGIGNDTFTDGAGNDTMVGGADRDTFIGANAGDDIDGSGSGDDFDTLDLRGVGPISIVYDPLNAENGTVTFLDGAGNPTGTMGFVEIENVLSDVPDARPDTAVTPEDTPVTIPVLANDTDPNGQPLTVTEATAPHGTVTINPDGTLTYTPDPDYNGPDTITYTVTDPDGNQDTTTVAVTVTPDPDAPDAVDDTAVTNEDTPVTVPVLANDTDPNGQPLTVTTATAPNGTVTVNPDGTLTYTPDPNFNGTDTITYTITDPDGNTDTATVTVTVNPVNDAPVANDDASTTPLDTPITFAVMGNDTDVDGDTLAIRGIPTSADGTVTVNPNGTLTFTPNPGFTGAAVVNYTVVDPEGLTDTATWTITVTEDAPNRPPVAEDDVANTPVDTPVTIAILANDSDPDGDILTVVGTPTTTDGTVTVNPDGTITFTPDPGFVGEATINYLVSDGNGGTDPAVVTVTVVDPGTRDGIVRGTIGNDLIDVNYPNDNDGDFVDRGDAILPGDAPQDDRILAGAGNDTVVAGRGDDSVEGGTGNDVVNGQNGDDTIYGQSGDDTLIGQNGDDDIYGGLGNDSVRGGTGDDLIDTSGDTLPLPDKGYPGIYPSDDNPTDDLDTVRGGDGNDTIRTGDDNDLISGGYGNDLIDGGFDDDSIDGNQGNDTIIGAEGNDLIDGGQGDDLVYGGYGPNVPDAVNIPDATDLRPDNGRDSIVGGMGNDTIFGMDDDDTIDGGQDNDLIYGGIDEDSIRGNVGNDRLFGDEGNDTMSGGQGNDTLNGGQGTDLLEGDADRDVFLVGSQPSGTGDTVHGGASGDDWDILNLSGAGPYRLRDVVEDSDGNGIDGRVEFLDVLGNVTGTMTFTNIEEIVPCFTPGTLIATPKGEVPVESLKAGDRVITRDNGIQEIRWTGQKALGWKDLAANPHLKPVLIRQGSLGNGLPERDMMVSPNHRMLVANDRTALYFDEHEVLVSAKHLVAGQGIQSIDSIGTTYIHFMFDRHEVVLSNGAWTESFQPGDYTLKGMGNAQRNEIFELFPELKTEAGLNDYQAARRTLKKHEARLLVK